MYLNLFYVLTSVSYTHLFPAADCISTPSTSFSDALRRLFLSAAAIDLPKHDRLFGIAKLKKGKFIYLIYTNKSVGGN